MTTKTANKILVVDDDSDILDFLIELLHDEVSVSFASEGEKALELVKLHKPDLILLDVMMPGMNGFEVCKRLKSDHETEHIPVVFLTGKDNEVDIVKGLELGAIDYITKPFDRNLVATKIQNFLKQITATRASTKPKEDEKFVPGQTADRRTEGPRRPDRYAKDEKGANSGVMDRRAEGGRRPDRYPKTPEKNGGLSLTQVFFIALVIVVVGGGGYAWYSNTFVNGMNGTGSVSEPDSAEKTPSRDLTEKDLQAVIAEAHEQAPAAPKSSDAAGESSGEPQVPAAPSISTATCGNLPSVPWWGNTSHGSVIAYVNDRNGGDWNSYIAKWERQLSKLESIHAKDGTVIAPKLGTRLKGPVLGKYITQVQKRIEITRCLATKLATK